MDDESKAAAHPGADVYLLTWIALLMLTATTVTVAGLHLGRLSVLSSIAIAFVKATVVLSFFMHLKYERRMLKLLVYLVIGGIAALIALTFTDFLFR